MVSIPVDMQEKVAQWRDAWCEWDGKLRSLGEFADRWTKEDVANNLAEVDALTQELASRTEDLAIEAAKAFRAPGSELAKMSNLLDPSFIMWSLRRAASANLIDRQPGSEMAQEWPVLVERVWHPVHELFRGCYDEARQLVRLGPEVGDARPLTPRHVEKAAANREAVRKAMNDPTWNAKKRRTQADELGIGSVRSLVRHMKEIRSEGTDRASK